MKFKPSKIREMINKQCSFIIDDDIRDLQSYVVMRLDELVEEEGVTLNGHGTHDWLLRVKNFIQTSNREGIKRMLGEIESVPYPKKFKEDAVGLLNKFCLSE